MKYPVARSVLPTVPAFLAHWLTSQFRSLWAFPAELLPALTNFRSNWRVTGAIAPSSPSLSSSLAGLALGADHVLELGAGSGAVTKELLKLFPVGSIQAVEVQSRLANELKLKYPAIDVFKGTAEAALEGYQRGGVTAVVSSLPFRSLPSEVRKQTVRSIFNYLSKSPGSRFVQFTYGLRQPFEVERGFCWVRVKWVANNLPPACIWMLAPIVDDGDSDSKLGDH
jgi:phosphatidylethanolamine/phosphatidyl-N-methylethanolamine N-methyltransferase